MFIAFGVSVKYWLRVYRITELQNLRPSKPKKSWSPVPYFADEKTGSGRWGIVEVMVICRAREEKEWIWVGLLCELSAFSSYRLSFSSVQLLSHVHLFETPWIAARQASLSITNSRSSLRLTSIESVVPPSHLILCRPLLLLPVIPPIIRVFFNESTLRMRWPKYWSFSFSIIPSKEIPGLIFLVNL